MELPDEIIIEQKKEVSEIIWGFEFKNFYEVQDKNNTPLLHILETGGSGTRRAWNNYAVRPFEFQIHDPKTKEHLLNIRAPIRLFWYSVEISKSDSSTIASATRVLSLRGRHFRIDGMIKGYITGFWLYWKYKLKLDDDNECTMTRKWNGFFRIFLFGASRFQLQFRKTTSPKNRLYLLALSFLPEMLYHDPNK